MDTHSEALLALVHPGFADTIRALAADLEEQGVTVRVTAGFRTYADQAALYAKGRTAPGSPVTNAQPGYSMHNMGLAVDLVPDTIHGAPFVADWNGNDDNWKKMIAAGEHLGLNCGADWHSFKDEPHFQAANVPTTPNDAMRSLLQSAGVKTLWAAVDAGHFAPAVSATPNVAQKG